VDAVRSSTFAWRRDARLVIGLDERRSSAQREAMFDLDHFIADCRSAAASAEAHGAIRELVERAVSDASSVATALGEPEHAGVRALHRSPELTIIELTWAPWMTLKPHNHNMWSVVGMLFGREDNLFWRRGPSAITAIGARSLCVGDVLPLGRDVIHSVVNPIGKVTRAIHVYGGDFFEPKEPRSEWDPELLTERPWDIEDTLRIFADAEARFRATATR